MDVQALWPGRTCPPSTRSPTPDGGHEARLLAAGGCTVRCLGQTTRPHSRIRHRMAAEPLRGPPCGSAAALVCTKGKVSKRGAKESSILVVSVSLHESAS